ncbi:testis-expressed protein 10 homolog [Diadema setosum]|uniref:testis-expressed protein 10 homolog n=1 Tax=Diadema setosum TaxID=31175 RepID=UPI003B3AA916
MGKSARKNKQKKKDFQKVKLKAGKTKPKADNFTDTTFKSRAIQIRDQLKSSEHGEGEPVTERKQSLQDLLIQLNHYNSSVRSAALLGIKSLLTSHSNLLHAHLSTLIPALSAVTSDKDPSVRRTGSSLLRVVMANLSANQMSPFFQAVCTHLCCAMTHIQEDIQLYSLEVMESILQHYPGLVAPHSKALLPNFIHLISQQQSKLGGAGATGSKLKVNPSGKLSGQKWRLKVLQMLQKLLEVAKETKGRGNGAGGGGGGRRGSSIKNLHSLKPVIVATETSRPAHVPMMRTAASLNFKQKQIVLRDDQSVAGRGGDFLSDPTSIREVCHTLIPLMLQCWGEVNLPARGKQAEGWVTLGKQEAETLHCVLSILQAVWELLERACTDRGDESTLNAVRQTYQRKLQQHFEQGFPYSCHPATPAAKHTKKGPPASRSATPTNLAACNLLLSALPTSGNRSRHWMRRVRGFVVDVLQGSGGERERLSREELLLLIRVVKQTVENADSYEERNFLIDVLFGYYQDAFPLSQQKLVSLGCISELCVDTVTPDEANRSDKLREFFQSVGRLVCEARDGNIGIAHEALGTLLKAASRGFYDALDCIQENIVGWMDHKDSKNSPEAADFQRRVIECLFYLPSFDNRLLASLTNHCCRPDVDVKVPIYILVNRCFENVLGAPRPLLSHADLMELLLSVSIGHSQESLATLQAQMQSDQPLPILGGSSALGTVQPSFHIVLDASKAEDTQRFAKINKVM